MSSNQQKNGNKTAKQKKKPTLKGIDNWGESLDIEVPAHLADALRMLLVIPAKNSKGDKQMKHWKPSKNSTKKRNCKKHGAKRQANKLQVDDEVEQEIKELRKELGEVEKKASSNPESGKTNIGVIEKKIESSGTDEQELPAWLLNLLPAVADKRKQNGREKRREHMREARKKKLQQARFSSKKNLKGKKNAEAKQKEVSENVVTKKKFKRNVGPFEVEMTLTEREIKVPVEDTKKKEENEETLENILSSLSEAEKVQLIKLLRKIKKA